MKHSKLTWLVRLVSLGLLPLIYANAQSVEAITGNFRVMIYAISGVVWLIYAMFSAWDWMSQSRAHAVEFPTQRLLLGAALGIGVNALATSLGLI